MEQKSLKQYLQFIAIILLVLSMGLFVVNQIIVYRYKAIFLASPCKLCGDLNPDVESCLKELNNPRAVYFIDGEWKSADSFGNYTINITPSS